MDYPFMRIPLDALRDGPWSWQGEFSADPAVWSAPGLDLTGNPRLTICAEEFADGSVVAQLAGHERRYREWAPFLAAAE